MVVRPRVCLETSGVPNNGKCFTSSARKLPETLEQQLPRIDIEKQNGVVSFGTRTPACSRNNRLDHSAAHSSDIYEFIALPNGATQHTM